MAPGSDTGMLDKHGREIVIGQRLKDKAGLTGEVVFAFGAFRIDHDGYQGGLLPYNSSLIHSDRTTAKDFEIVT